MSDFKFKWLTLYKALINNLIRVAAIYKKKLLIRNRDNDHSAYYRSLDILDDKWFSELPTSLIDQINFLKEKGAQSYLVETFFFDHIIKNNNYKTILDFGCGNGRLASVLAALNPDIKFLCLDINNSTEKLNEKYILPNMQFFNASIYDFNKNIPETETLMVARMSLAYFSYKEVKNILSLCKKKSIDVSIADVTRFRLNEKSEISYTQNSQFVYAHPYDNLLKELGFTVKINVQNHSALMNFTTYLFPEYLTFFYGKNNNNI
tara:strand:- start:2589 stop:3377 length:789 start_codon:yes stop_codon:yes gene_type:complete